MFLRLFLFILIFFKAPVESKADLQSKIVAEFVVRKKLKFLNDLFFFILQMKLTRDNRVSICSCCFLIYLNITVV